jgi:DNA-binding LacI/PurR family transcriptional regulator
MRRAVDGVIMVPYHLTTEEIDALIRRTGTAIVALGQHVVHPAVDVAYADEERATINGIRWLIENKGHQRIGFIGTDARFPPGLRRWRAFKKAMDEAGLPIEPSFVQHGDFSSESGYASMQTLLAQPERPTAVFACNDRMAMGAIGAAQDMNVRVPDDVAVMGFDNFRRRRSSALISPLSHSTPRTAPAHSRSHRSGGTRKRVAAGARALQL